VQLILLLLFAISDLLIILFELLNSEAKRNKAIYHLILIKDNLIQMIVMTYYFDGSESRDNWLKVKIIGSGMFLHTLLIVLDFLGVREKNFKRFD